MGRVVERALVRAKGKEKAVKERVWAVVMVRVRALGKVLTLIRAALTQVAPKPLAPQESRTKGNRALQAKRVRRAVQAPPVLKLLACNN